MLEVFNITSNSFHNSQSYARLFGWLSHYWADYLTIAFNSYDPVAFWRMLPHHIGARPITLALKMHTLQSWTLQQIFIRVNSTDTLCIMYVED